jgi:hypothetical protein
LDRGAQLEAARLQNWITGLLGTFVGIVLLDRGTFALTEDFVVKQKELKAALRAITAVLNEPRLDPGQRDQLQKARRGLAAAGRSGKVDRQKVFRAVEMVSGVLLQVVEKDEGP